MMADRAISWRAAHDRKRAITGAGNSAPAARYQSLSECQPAPLLFDHRRAWDEPSFPALGNAAAF
jgi:hypothetical protein